MDNYQPPQKENHGAWVYVFIILVIAVLVFWFVSTRSNRVEDSGQRLPSQSEQEEIVNQIRDSRQNREPVQLSEEEQEEIVNQIRDSRQNREPIQLSEDEQLNIINQIRSSR